MTGMDKPVKPPACRLACNGHLVRDIEKQFRDWNLRGISDAKAVRIKDRDWLEARPREWPLLADSVL